MLLLKIDRAAVDLCVKLSGTLRTSSFKFCLLSSSVTQALETTAQGMTQVGEALPEFVLSTLICV